VGRGEDASATISNPGMSLEHARIFIRENKLQLADLNSELGTFVNGKEITLVRIKGGDDIRMAGAVFRIVQTKPSKKPAPPSAGPEEIVLASDRPPPSRPRAPSAKSPVQRSAKKSSSSQVEIHQRILQFNRIDAKKGRTFLSNDFSQYGGITRLVLVVVFLGLAVGAFFLFKWMGSEVTPGDPGQGSEIRNGEDPEKEEGF
jgi:hypothetical protein